MENWPRVELDPFNDKDQDMCFGCGKANPIGLKLKFTWDAERKTASADFIPDINMQGWAGFLHGGITACVLDEAIGWAAMYAGTNNVTAKLQVRYRKMIPVGGKYVVSAHVSKHNSRLIETEALIQDEYGNIMAEGSSTQFIVSERKDVPQK